ncbi:MAG: L,D-transpeptidase [Actinomycetota bacterium]
MRGWVLRSWTFVAVLAVGAAIGAPLAGVAAGPEPRAENRAPAERLEVAEAGSPARTVSPVVPIEGSNNGRERRPKPEPHLFVRVPRDLALTSRPGGGRIVGTVPDGSRFYDVPTMAWVQQVSEDGRFGRLAVPYGNGDGWMRLDGLRRGTTWVEAHVDLSDRRLTLEKRDKVVFRTRSAIGASVSPTPPGRYFVTDRIPFDPGSSLGRFAFGISGIQPNLPPGWSGGDQLAIHGTNVPSSIGQAASAGCMRVSASALERLKPFLRLGTPVIVSR